MTVRTSILWKMNIHMAKKWPEKVLQRSIIKGHSFRNSLYIWYIQIVIVLSGFTKKLFCIFTYLIPLRAHNIKKIKSYELGINVSISWTYGMKNISKNQNLYPLWADPNYFFHFAMRYPVAEEQEKPRFSLMLENSGIYFHSYNMAYIKCSCIVWPNKFWESILH